MRHYNRLEKQIRRCLLATAVLGSTLCLAAPVERETAPWLPSLYEIGYVPFLAPTTKRLNEVPIPGPPDVINSVDLLLARGETTSVQLGLLSIRGTTEKIRIEIDLDLEVTIYRVLPSAVYPDRFKGKWAQAGYWSPYSTLHRDNVIPAIGEGAKQAYWITFHISCDTERGVHEGRILLHPENRPPTELGVKITVLPFELPVARAAFGVYINRDFLPPQSHRSPHWLEAIYRDMADHGQNSVTFYEAGNFSTVPPNSTMYRQMLPVAKKVGLIHKHVPCLYLQGSINGLTPEQQNAAIAWRKQQREIHGWPELIEYGRDEPPYPHPELRKNYSAFRNVPVRLTTAMSIRAAYGFGDLHDTWIVYGGQITAESCAEARRLGAEPWTYSCHMLQGRSPAPHRYHAGLYTWAYELGGNWQWAYHWYVWWDESDQAPRSSTEWENRRDGIIDFRYLQLCEDCVTANPEHPASKAARQWLDRIRHDVINSFPDPHLVREGKPLTLEDYINIRHTAAKYIEQIGSESAGRLTHPQPPGLKDEARPYRGRSIDACISALEGEGITDRRAAASSLAERGVEAAPATTALALLLDDNRTCIPAARALDAIGSSAAAAIPALDQLVKHRDGFVRLAAVFALKSIGEPDPQHRETTERVVDVLRRTLLDEFHPVAKASGDALISYGPAAAAALPEAKKLQDMRTYKLYIWPYTDFPKKIIEAISND